MNIIKESLERIKNKSKSQCDDCANDVETCTSCEYIFDILDDSELYLKEDLTRRLDECKDKQLMENDIKLIKCILGLEQ